MGAVSVRKAATCVRAIGGTVLDFDFYVSSRGLLHSSFSFAKQGSVG